MSQVITNAFEQYWQSSLAAEQPVVLDEFILADIPNLDITSPIDPDTGLPPESQIVHRQNVDQRGRINKNAVAYTIVMDTTVGDFSFNAMYLRNKQNGVIGMIVYKGRETKLKTDQTTGQTGNSLVKSMLMGYDQAAEATLTHVDAGTWQIDYAARLRGMDDDIRQLQADLYGHHTFIGDGFKVVEKDGAYQVTQGVAIVGGLRVELKAPEVIHPGTKPIGVWVDVHRAGSLLSEHQNHFTIVTSVANLTDHMDDNGYQHYVAKLGTVQADSTVIDGRGQGGSGGSGAIPDTFALWKRSMAEAGYDLIGQFGTEKTIETADQVLLSKDGTEVYAWQGDLPKNVDKNSSPENSGGENDGAWKKYNDEILRTGLSKPGGSQLLGFKGRNIYEKLSDVVSVLDYGADPSGSMDSTEAFRLAYAEVKKRQHSNQSAVFCYSAPKFHIPGGGKFLISGNIDEATGSADSMQGIKIVSDGGIVIGSGSFNLFNFRTNCSITGLSVHGCGRVFYIQSGNSDSAKFDIDDCTFQNQLVEAWGDDGASASSIINITRSKLYQVKGGADYPRLATMKVDTVQMSGNWIYYGGVGSPFYTDCQVFDFDNNLCVPNFLLESNSQRSWFYNHRTLNLRGNRFGAEGGGCTIVEHSGKYTTGEMKVTARDNAIYSSNDVPFKFYALPTAIDIDSNFGYDLSPGVVQFGTSITVGEIQTAMARGDIYINDITTREYQVSGNRDVMRSMASESAVSHSATNINEIVISANTDLGVGSRVGTSTGSVHHNYGDGRTGRKFTATGAIQLISFLINPAGVSEIHAAIATNEWMTVVYNITNPGTSPISGHIVNGLKKEPILIPPGDHYYAFSSPKFSGVDPNVSGTVLLQEGDTIIIGPLRVFKGVKNAAVIPSQFIGSTIPASGRFFSGELIRNTSPVASGYLYWICTTAGDPGTWKNACSIAA